MSFLGPPKRILVIDDEEGIVEYIRIILRTRGYESIPAYDGEQGLALLKSESPDLVISDLRMPKMSGLELARRRKELPRDLASIPLLVISSMGSEQERPDSFWCEGLGCDDFLAKPFEPLTLLGRVEALLRREKYRSHETPAHDLKPKVAAGKATPGRATKPPVRSYTVEPEPRPSSAAEPVDVVRQLISSGHQDQTLLESGDVSQGLRQPTAQTRVLDASTLYRTSTEAEIAVLREEPGIQAGEEPVAYDERYTLEKNGQGEWKVTRIHQERLIPEL